MNPLVDEFLGELDVSMKEHGGRRIIDEELWVEAMELAFHPDPRVAFRASWALESAYFASPGGMLPHMERFVDVFLEATNQSVHRQYSKMLCDMQRSRMVVVDDVRLARIAEKSYDLLVAHDTRPAVMVWCMEILFDISPRLDWVGEALREALHMIMENNPSRGVANRASKMLRKLG